MRKVKKQKKNMKTKDVSLLNNTSAKEKMHRISKVTKERKGKKKKIEERKICK